jgi:AcrR family transcriptional regulator
LDLELSSQAKPRGNEKKPRIPKSERGLVRYESLLDATDRLLIELEPDEVGLYQIAEEANASPSSVYHFFPTKEAALLALAHRYLEGIRDLDRMTFDVGQLESWQDLMKLDHENARTYYNSHPPALKLLFSGYGGIESRKLDERYTSEIVNSMYERYNSVFHMPKTKNENLMFTICFAILDSIWAVSYRRHGHISPDFLREGHAACVAYCRRYLPERTVPREDVQRSFASRLVSMSDILGHPAS